MLNLRWLLIFDGITIRLSLDAMPSLFSDVTIIVYLDFDDNLGKEA